MRPLLLLGLLPLLCTCAGPHSAPETSVKPGINDAFLSPDLDVDAFVTRFEGESREIFAQRHRIARAVGLQAGAAVADVGAGTGLFTELFAQDVGENGRVYAIDIAPKFVAHVERRAQARGLTQVRPVLGTAQSIMLAAETIDAAFVCDTYHHFEYPGATLASIRSALRPEGTLVVVDFERIPGVSRQWILDHVRAGKDVFRDEIERAGFVFVEQVGVTGLRENYVLRFRKG